MNILIISPEYPPKNIGGGGIAYKNLARELAKLGHKVTVFSGDFQNRKIIGKIKSFRDERVLVHFIPLIIPPSIFRINLATYTPPTFPGLLFIIKKIIQEKYDIIHLHGLGHPLIDITSLVCVLFNRRYVFTCHGIPKSPEIVGNIFGLIFRIYLLSLGSFVVLNAKAITTVSKALLMECKRIGLFNSNTLMIPNGLNPDLKEVKPSVVKKVKEKYSLKNRSLIFSIGRLTLVKGFQYLIEAMPFVVLKFPDSIAIIAGTGPYQEDLKDLIEKKDLSGCIKLLGRVSENEKAALYTASDVVVFPSIYEPFGIALLEAMSMQKSVIAFNKPPMSEIIRNEVEGLLVTPGHVKELAKAIVRILLDDNLKESIATNAQIKAKSFQWKDIAKNYVVLYLEAFRNNMGDKN